MSGSERNGSVIACLVVLVVFVVRVAAVARRAPFARPAGLVAQIGKGLQQLLVVLARDEPLLDVALDHAGVEQARVLLVLAHGSHGNSGPPAACQGRNLLGVRPVVPLDPACYTRGPCRLRSTSRR